MRRRQERCWLPANLEIDNIITLFLCQIEPNGVEVTAMLPAAAICEKMTVLAHLQGWLICPEIEKGNRKSGSSGLNAPVANAGYEIFSCTRDTKPLIFALMKRHPAYWIWQAIQWLYGRRILNTIPAGWRKTGSQIEPLLIIACQRAPSGFNVPMWRNCIRKIGGPYGGWNDLNRQALYVAGWRPEWRRKIALTTILERHSEWTEPGSLYAASPKR